MKDKLRELVSDPRPVRQRLALMAAAAGLFAFTLLIFGPYELYFTNCKELWFPFSRIWWQFALLAVLAFGAVFGLGALMKGKLFNVYATAVFALALALYIQGNYLNLDYGALNGVEIPWERFGAYSLINTGLVLAIVLIPFLVLYFSKKAWAGMLGFVSLVLVLMQTATLGYLGLFTDVSPQQGDYGLGWDGALELSGDGSNIVVIVLDTFDNKYVAQLTDAEPEALSFLDGFTYYPNTAGIYKFTYPAMTAELTGELWYHETAYQDKAEYMARAWRHDELFTGLHDQGYDVRVLGSEVYLGDARPDLIDNYETDPKVVTSYKELTKKMLQFVLFKYLPHALKPGFWLYTGEFTQYRELNIYQMIDPLTYQRFLSEGISAGWEGNAFRLYHLTGMHEPYTLNENVETVPEAETSKLKQMQGTIKLARTILEQMRSAGVYDDSYIILMADHGESHGNLLTEPSNPLLMIKLPGEQGPLKESAAPAWMLDLKPTLLDMAGVEDYADYVTIGTSVLDLTEDTQRERFLLCTHEKDEEGNALTEFVINGDARDWSSWSIGRKWKEAWGSQG